MITGRSWIDFVSYCADFPDNNQLFVFRLHSENYREETVKLTARLLEFNDYVKQIKRVIKKQEPDNP